MRLVTAFVTLLVCSMVLSPALWRSRATAGDGKQHVLILHSYHKGLEWTDSEDQGILSVLKSRSPDIDVHTEYMDTKRISTDAYYSGFSRFLKRKYAAIAFQVVLVTDDDAFNFYLKYHQALFPGVPAVFCGVNYFKDSDRAGRQGLITGVVEAFDIPNTLRTALRLHPDTTRVIVINDRTTTGLANKKILEEVRPEFEEKVSFVFLENVDMAEVLEEVGYLAKGDLILLMTFNRDRSGNVYDYDQSIALISRAARVPIYGVWDFYLGKGIVGGMLTSGRDQGRTAAEIALRIVNGEKVRNIPVVQESPNRYMFDYLQLKRFRLRQSELPENSIVINLPDSFYGRYKRFILVSAAIIATLSLIIVILLVNISLRKRFEKALRESEEKYRDLYDHAPDMYHSINREGIILDCNATEVAMLGYPKEEIVGRPIADFLTEDSRKTHEREFSTLTEHRTLFGLEREFRRKDGATFTASLNVFIDVDAQGRLTRTKTIGRDVTEQKRVEEALRKSREELRSLSDHIQSALEEERGHIAREIHVELGQVLSKLKLDLAWLKKRLGGDQQPLREKTEAMSGLVDSTIKTVQRISSALRPGVLDYLGLAAAIEWQAQEFRDQTGIDCTVAVPPDGSVPDQDVATAVFRIFQEALTNVIRHARATRVAVRLEKDDGAVRLAIQDNGRGIPDEKAASHASFGLISMKERARFLGGRVSIDSLPGEGTTITVNIPCRKAATP
ncbi:MAG: PAS domain S-box protein [Deltaproteobacteria bacterium]|nr:PAS domain S-box protein [Deltaproteobacteria bacterium]